MAIKLTAHACKRYIERVLEHDLGAIKEHLASLISEDEAAASYTAPKIVRRDGLELVVHRGRLAAVRHAADHRRGSAESIHNDTSIALPTREHSSLRKLQATADDSENHLQEACS